jgi:cytochrome c556
MNLLKKLTLTLLGLALLASAFAADNDPVEKAIKARIAAMTIRSWNAGPLFGMAKGKIDYDADLAAALANNLKVEAHMSNASMWPDGSDNVAYKGKTRSLPEVWSTWPAVGEAGQAYKDATVALAEVAGNGLEALQSKIGDLGNSCKDCHDDFRAEDM